MNPTTTRSAINRVHEDSVRTAMAVSKDNRVLGARPPLVDPSERSLPRETKTDQDSQTSFKITVLES